MDEWDNDSSAAQEKTVIKSNKWEGEDEEDDVKDSWEDLEEEKKDNEKIADLPKPKAKTKKVLTEKIQEHDRKLRRERETKFDESNDLTPEEKRAELIRRQKLQEEADLRVAMETFGDIPIDTRNKIDDMMPNNATQFEEFREALMRKISQFNKHPDFPSFAEELLKSISLHLSSNSLKKVKTCIDNLMIEKIKIEKGDKGKKSKGKIKAKLKIEGENEYDTVFSYENEYDDFM